MMNVYDIGDYLIASKDADSAFDKYLEEESGIDIGNLDEGETHEVTITVRRLTNDEIESKTMPCCSIWNDGCDFCEGKDEEVLVSPAQIIEKLKEYDFPAVIGRED